MSREIAAAIEQMRDELEGAEDYARCAVRLRDTDQQRSRTYAEMATQELGHYDKLHSMVVAEIDRAGETVPEGMMAVYEWEHDKLIDCYARVKTLIESAR